MADGLSCWGPFGQFISFVYICRGWVKLSSKHSHRLQFFWGIVKRYAKHSSVKSPAVWKLDTRKLGTSSESGAILGDFCRNLIHSQKNGTYFCFRMVFLFCFVFLSRRLTGLYYLNPADNTKFTNVLVDQCCHWDNGNKLFASGISSSHLTAIHTTSHIVAS